VTTARHDSAGSGAAGPIAVRRSEIRDLVLLVAAAIGLYVCYLLAFPFLPALAWALAIAVLAAPLHARLERRLKHGGAAAAVSVVLLALIVILPVAFLGQHVASVLSAGVSSLQQQLAGFDWQRLRDAFPWLGRIDANVNMQDFASVFGNVGSWLTNLTAAFARESLSNVVTLLLTFYLLFYFLRDRTAILDRVRSYLPLAEAEADHVFGRVSDTIHGVVFGTVVTAAVQGTLGGLIFWLLGLPDPLFWGTVMALLAVVPVLGAFVIWIPAAIYLAVSGEWGKAAVLAAYGAVVIGGIDNVLHPMLAGGRLGLHTVTTLIAIVGGLMLFGASGLILGPLAVTVTLAVLQIWRARADGADLRAGDKHRRP
jgi:predicted PurR-regulated permease PerM